MRQELVAPFVAKVLPATRGVLKLSEFGKHFSDLDAFVAAIHPPEARARLFGEQAGAFGEIIKSGASPTDLNLGNWYERLAAVGKITEADHEAALTAEVLGAFPASVVRAWFGSGEWYMGQSEAARGLKSAVLQLILAVEGDDESVKNLLFDFVEGSLYDNAPREKLAQVLKQARREGVTRAVLGTLGVAGLVEHASPKALWAFFEEVLDRRWAGEAPEEQADSSGRDDGSAGDDSEDDDEDEDDGRREGRRRRRQHEAGV